MHRQSPATNTVWLGGLAIGWPATAHVCSLTSLLPTGHPSTSWGQVVKVALLHSILYISILIHWQFSYSIILGCTFKVCVFLCSPMDCQHCQCCKQWIDQGAFKMFLHVVQMTQTTDIRTLWWFSNWILIIFTRSLKALVSSRNIKYCKQASRLHHLCTFAICNI